MAAKKPIVAIAYDFDGTLAPGNMQERDYIPGLGLDPKAFWREVKAYAEQHDMDEILAYMELMLFHAKAKRERITRDAFESFGAKLELFPASSTVLGANRVTMMTADRSGSLSQLLESRLLPGLTSSKRFLLCWGRSRRAP